MGLRDTSMQKFGPKLIEAIVLLILDEINILRAEHSLPERTTTQLLTQLSDQVDEISDYDWM